MTKEISDRVTQTDLDGHRSRQEAQKDEGLYYLCSENKNDDQLCGHCTADLRHFV